MSKVQKSNYKRKYRRQQKRMEEEGVTKDHFQHIVKQARDPSLWTDNQCNAKLQAIKSKFPIAPDKQNASRFDYTSMLNMVCQKCRINLPEFQECAAGCMGGFAYKCRVGLTWYQGLEYCSTKKDAKHECARWALLGMEIPGIGKRVSMSVNRIYYGG